MLPQNKGLERTKKKIEQRLWVTKGIQKSIKQRVRLYKEAIKEKDEENPENMKLTESTEKSRGSIKSQ